jgi:FlgD Ig-like domain
MNQHLQKGSISSVLAGLAIMMAAVSVSPNARANVYATNIKLNGALSNATVAQGSGVTISYILNEPATLGTTVNIMSGATVVRTYNFASGSAGALRGLNSVTWDGKNGGGTSVGAGTYSVSITAAASGFTNWTQTSIDSSNTVAVFPHGIAVNNNTNSPYYGRVVMGNNVVATQHGVTQNVGLYKMNADGSPADEGTFGYAGYTTNDSGAVAVGQMAAATGVPTGNNNLNPYIIRIGADDRIYWADNSFAGAIVACDMLATTNQVVISEGPGNGGSLPASVANPTSPNNYSANPDAGLLNQGGTGIRQFDVTSANTTNAAIWLVDVGDYPSWGVWMWHMTNGVADPNDNVGTKAVATGGDIGFVVASGVTVDEQLDIFVSQNRSNAGDANNRTILFTNWNGGILPPGGQGYAIAETFGAAWAVGAFDNSSCNIKDTVINSRTSPTLVALPMLAGNANTFSGGIRVLNAADGSILNVTNNALVTQTLTNLDYPNQYSAAAWDNVGNLYGASTTTNYWRVWSPPGTNQATTVAVQTINVIVPTTITQITVTGSVVTIKFTAPDDLATAFTLLGSSSVAPASGYLPVAGATITRLSAGSFQATASTSGATQYYRIKK